MHNISEFSPDDADESTTEVTSPPNSTYIPFFKNIALNFAPARSLNLTTLNRILQTSLEKQLRSTGNMGMSMFQYIDENKYLLSDNRVPFIRHSNNDTIFYIENSELSFNNFVTNVYERLTNSTNVYIPFVGLENTLKNRKRKIQEEARNEEQGLIENRDTITKTRINETSDLLKMVKADEYIELEERMNILKLLKMNMYVEFVNELDKPFLMDDGETILRNLSDEQKDCLNGIIDYAFKKPMLPLGYKIFDKDPFYKIFLIEGSAGCGKSAIIEGLNFYIYKNHSKFSRLLYVTQTNVLCQSMRKKCYYNSGMQYLTFFKFLSVLDLNYYDKKQLLLNCDALQIDAFQNTCGVDFVHNIKDIVNLPPMNDRDEESRLFIIFDEIYTVSNGKLSLFLFIIRCIKLQYPRLNIYTILIGDKMQLRPFTKLENIKLDVIHTEPVPSSPSIKPEPFIKEEPLDDEYNNNDQNAIQDNITIKKEKIDDLNILSQITQNESLANATRFVLTKQFRIIDEKYNEFVNTVREAESRENIGIELLRAFKDFWPTKIINSLTVKYPIDEILTILKEIDMTNYKDLVIAFEKKMIFTKTLDTTVFCFTNKHAHYYNLALTFSYWNQIKEKCDNKTNDFIIFSVIFNCDYLQITSKLKITELINKNNHLINILPLIRYCPYKVLTSNCPVARLSVVYLLDWNINEDGHITHLIVFSQDTNCIFSILPGRFEMNLFKNIYLFGFPLQFAFSSTFASSQGLTLNNKIAISCANISKAELYVCLTRIKKADDLVGIY